MTGMTGPARSTLEISTRMPANRVQEGDDVCLNQGGPPTPPARSPPSEVASLGHRVGYHSRIDSISEGSAKTPITSLDPRSMAFTPHTRADKRTDRSPGFTRRFSNLNISQQDGITPLHSEGTPSTPETALSTPASYLSYALATPATSRTWQSTDVLSARALGCNAHDRKHASLGQSGHQAFLDLPSADSAGADEPGHFLMITSVPSTVSGEQIRRLIQDIAPFKSIILKFLHSKGWVIIAFYDSRHTWKVWQELNSSSIQFTGGAAPVQCHCVSISSVTVRQLVGNGEEFEAVWKESESAIKIQIHGTTHGIDVEGMKRCLQTIGDLQDFGVHDMHNKVFTAKFFDTRRAADAIRVLNNHLVNTGVLRVAHLIEDPFQSKPLGSSPRPPAPAPATYTLGSAAYETGSSRLETSSLFHRHHSADSIASSSTFYRDSSLTEDSLELDKTHARHGSAPAAWRSIEETEVSPMLPVIGRRLSEPAALQGLLNQMDASARARQRQLQHGRWPADRQAIPPENMVDPARIIAGLDARTSVMVKDVPNKLSRQELIDILDAVVPGEFDFVYLRYDWESHANVGYAFVNFVSLQALYAFIQARVGKPWNMFSSSKVLQVSYANIQGKAALINKFRNSSVMDRIEAWRPQIFYSSGALKGKPEPFPEPDSATYRHRPTLQRLPLSTGTVHSESFNGYDSSVYPTTGF